SAHTKPLKPGTPEKGCVSRKVPSPLFLKTDGTTAESDPSTTSRSPSASISTAQAPVYDRLRIVAGSFVSDVTSVKVEGLSCRMNRTPSSPASTKSVLKS